MNFIKSSKFFKNSEKGTQILEFKKTKSWKNIQKIQHKNQKIIQKLRNSESIKNQLFDKIFRKCSKNSGNFSEIHEMFEKFKKFL